MVYANDQWILLPVKDLYDNLMMLAAINAAKDMYDRGQQEIKDFRKKYDDFVAASPQDQAWYNKEFNIGGFVNDLYKQGIDPFRSRQGRALVQEYINSRDIATFGNLKKSVEIGQEFNKNKAALQRAGLYNRAIAELEGPDPEQWDTVANRSPFSRLSPTPYKDMATFSAPYFEGLKPIQRHEKKDGITYNTYSITEKDLHDIADRHFNDLVITPQGQLMYKMFKNQAGGDEAKAREMFNDAVVTGNLRRRQYTDDFDQRKLEIEKMGLERQKMALSREIATIRANNGRGRRVKLGPNGEVMIDDDEQMTPWLTKAIMAHQMQYGRNIVGDVRQGLSLFKNTIQNLYNNYANAMVEESKRAGAHGKKVVDVPEKSHYDTTLMPGTYGAVMSNKVIDTREKYHMEYPSVKTKAYKDLQSSRNKMYFILNDIKIIENGQPDRKNFSTNEAYNNSMKAYQNAAKNLSKYIDAAGMPTAALEAELAKVDLQRILNISTDKQLIKYANDWYSRRENRSNYDPNSVSYQNFLGILGASKDEEHIPELGRDARSVSFDGVVYSPVHRINISGAGPKMSDKSIMSLFANWLLNSGQNGWLLNNKISTADVPRQGTNNHVIEANAWVTISPQLFEQFYVSLPRSITRKYKKKDVIAALGLRAKSLLSKLEEDGGIGKDFKSTTYYDVPVTGAHDTEEIMQGIEWNLGESKEYYGTSKTLNKDLEDSALDLLMY